ncbi:MAG: ankyrin repeat domain-containing protein [Candidatus Dependentiae bacterium]|nr:ankyrin repeat domain-containing protein [Candidatus Dependentiae bacterium]
MKLQFVFIMLLSVYSVVAMDVAPIDFHADSDLKSRALQKIERALFYSDPKEFKSIVQVNQAGIDELMQGEYTPLVCAVFKGDVPKVKILLECKADPNAQDKYGFSPVMVAAKMGDPELIDVLVNAGARVDTRNNDGHTPLLLAILSQQDEAAQCLLRHRADPNMATNEGNSPLYVHMVVSKYKMASVVSALLDAGADKSAMNSSGQTAADFSSRENILKLFERDGFDLD